MTTIPGYETCQNCNGAPHKTKRYLFGIITITLRCKRCGGIGIVPVA